MFSSWEQEGISLYVAVALMTRFTGMIAEVQQAASSTWSVLFWGLFSTVPFLETASLWQYSKAEDFHGIVWPVDNQCQK